MRYGRMFAAIVLMLLLVVGAAALGAYAYNMGIAQGVAQSGALVKPETPGAINPYYGTYGFARPWGWGFGFLGCLVPILFLFLIFGLFRFIFWRPHWGGPWMKHGWRGDWDPSRGDIPPMIQEWHRKLHEREKEGKEGN